MRSYNFNRNTNTGLITWISVVLITITIAIFLNLWVIPSVITSAVKAISNKCGTTYVVEKVWTGDFFCPEVTGNE